MNVLLVHGLGRSPLSLCLLARALRRAGHRTHFFAYSPMLETVPRIVRRLAARLRGLTGPVGLVGHSLGGVLLRLAIPEAPAVPVRRLVMIGSPNRPSRLARSASRHRLFRWLARGCGRLLASDTMSNIPAPTVAYTLIAGTAGPRGRYSPFQFDVNDGVVGVSEVPIRDGDEVLLFPVWHTVMMNNPAVHQAVLAALKGDKIRERAPVI